MITQAKFNEYVKDFSEAVRDEIQSRIIAEDAIDTGLMFRTVDYDLNGGANKFNLTFHIQDYGKFVDEGTRYITPREFYKKTLIKMANRFERYVKDKNDGYVTISTDIYGELELQISLVDRTKNTWWILKMNGRTDL